MALPIADYALIGDCRAAALVGKDGSIDWMCLPRFDSAACFAALLGAPEHGRWQIAPVAPVTRVTRRYRGDTLVLDTDFETDEGTCRVTDFMAMGSGSPTLARVVTGLAGRVRLGMELVVRFDYGQIVPWVTRQEDALVAVAGPDLLILRTPVRHRGDHMKTVAEFTVTAGEEVPFSLAYGPSHLAPPPPLDLAATLRWTEKFWRDWAARCNYDGPWRDAVVRSLLTLKALIYQPTGGIIAAPTTSLPERAGGARNWDYRFCWLRDATFVLLTLIQAGYRQEAAAWRAWLVRAVAGLPSQLQPLYGVRGLRRLDEWEVPWLPGYGDARPVRIGNDAFTQLQLDTFGEVLDVGHHARRSDLAPSAAGWAVQKALVEHLETLTDVVDHGIWEMRGPPQHFTHSKVMMWVAFDRAVAAVQDFGLDGPVERWRRTRDEIHAEICENAFDRTIGSFVQAYGSNRLDAATLLIPLVGFLPADDARVVGTVAAIEKRLMRDGLVYRYDTAGAKENLPPGEGAFLACSFWFIDNLALQGRHDAGLAMFERLLELRNDVGLLAEEYDPETGHFLGNFPQALSHLALIDTAYNLHQSQGPARQRAKREPGE